MTVSVFWQDYLTFGLLQEYLGERLPTGPVLVLSAVIFWAGHVLFLPDKFAPIHVLPSLAILALGFALASLRVRLRSLHLILALHLGFYVVFA
jgi:membrane protease YdiL (CAAX protease family)